MSYAIYAQKNKSALSDYTNIFIFDAITNIRESLPNSITKYPVAGESSRTDHIQPQNIQISFTGYVNNNPIPNNLGNTTTTNLLESEGYSRIQNAQLTLRGFRDYGYTFSFIMKNTVYKNCVISNLSFNTNPNTGDMLVANITIEQIRVASTSTDYDSVIADDTASTTTTSGGKSTDSTISSRMIKLFTDYSSDISIE